MRTILRSARVAADARPMMVLHPCENARRARVVNANGTYESDNDHVDHDRTVATGCVRASVSSQVADGSVDGRRTIPPSGTPATAAGLLGGPSGEPDELERNGVEHDDDAGP